MATEFSREFFADNRIVKASLRCAHKLREKDLDRIKSEIKKLYDATEVILNITVDESLLSGYVLQVGDRVFDNSGRHQLDKMMEGKPSLATLKTRIRRKFLHIDCFLIDGLTAHIRILSGHDDQCHQQRCTYSLNRFFLSCCTYAHCHIGYNHGRWQNPEHSPVNKSTNAVFHNDPCRKRTDINGCK